METVRNSLQNSVKSTERQQHYYNSRNLRFITISPPDSVHRVKYIFNSHLPTLLKANNCSKYFIFYPEMDINGRLHYHGILKISDNVKYYKQFVPSLKHLGYVKIMSVKSFSDHIKILKYISKDWQYMRHVLGLEKPIMPHKEQRKLDKIKSKNNRKLLIAKLDQPVNSITNFDAWIIKVSK